MSKIQLNACAIVLMLAAVMLGTRVRPLTLASPRSDFGKIPMRLAGWVGHDFPPDSKTQAQLPSASLFYRYYEKYDQIAPARMAIVYGTDLGNFHQPEVCLEGQGLKTVSKSTVRLKDGKGGTFEAVGLVTDMDYQRKVFIFWFYANGKASVSLGSYKFAILSRRLLNREVSPSAMIRLDTDVIDTEQEALTRLVAFANDVGPYLRAQFDVGKAPEAH